MGAGKSTVGRALANVLGWSFLDVDDLVEEITSLAVPEIFSRYGEAHFRREESRALARALGQVSTVIALGGGAPEILTNRLLVEQTPATFVILLTAPFPVLYDRCTLQAVASGVNLRPNLLDPAAALARYHQRIPFYRRLAHLTLDTTDRSVTATAEEAARHLRPSLAASRPLRRGSAPNAR